MSVNFLELPQGVLPIDNIDEKNLLTSRSRCLQRFCSGSQSGLCHSPRINVGGFTDIYVRTAHITIYTTKRTTLDGHIYIQDSRENYFPGVERRCIIVYIGMRLDDERDE